MHPREPRWDNNNERRFEPTNRKEYASRIGNGKDFGKRQHSSAAAVIAEFSKCSQCDSPLGLDVLKFCRTCFENHSLGAEAHIRQAQNRVATVEAEMLTLVADLESRAKLLTSRESENRRLQERTDVLEGEKARMLAANEELRSKVELKDWRIRCLNLEKQLVIFQNQELTINDLGSGLSDLRAELASVQREVRSRFTRLEEPLPS